MPGMEANAGADVPRTESFEITGGCTATTIIAGYACCTPDWMLPFHVHTYFELHLVTSGWFLYEVHDETHRLGVGDICLTRPGEFHRMSTSCDHNSEHLHLQIGSIHPNQIDSIIQKTTVRSVHSCHELIPILQLAIAELEQPGPLWQILVSSLVCQFLVCLSRRIWNAEELRVQHPRYAGDQAVVDVLWYLEHSCRHGITVDELARLAGVSKSALGHRFTSEVGESVCRHNQRLVMERARSLVEEGSLRLYEIADLLGFPSANYFTSAFKKHFGVSPSEHRVQHGWSQMRGRTR